MLRRRSDTLRWRLSRTANHDSPYEFVETTGQVIHRYPQPLHRHIDSPQAAHAQSRTRAGVVAMYKPLPRGEGDRPLFAALLGLQTEGRYGILSLTPQQQRARTLQALVDQLVGLTCAP
jgi:hypothetical protein